MKHQLRLVLVDVRSAHNVGSLLRTAEAMAVESVALVGITPYPKMPNDQRLPHVIQKADRELSKTALGAETTLHVQHWEKTELEKELKKWRSHGWQILALEQTAAAKQLNTYSPPDKCVLIVGNEVDGLDADCLELADVHLQIPMLGQKESLNVAVAGGIGLYHLRFGGRG